MITIVSTVPPNFTDEKAEMIRKEIRRTLKGDGFKPEDVIVDFVEVRFPERLVGSDPFPAGGLEIEGAAAVLGEPGAASGRGDVDVGRRDAAVRKCCVLLPVAAELEVVPQNELVQIAATVQIEDEPGRIVSARARLHPIAGDTSVVPVALQARPTDRLAGAADGTVPSTGRDTGNRTELAGWLLLL